MLPICQKWRASHDSIHYRSIHRQRGHSRNSDFTDRNEGRKMKETEALEQLEMCALGYCDKCVHNGDDCRDRIRKDVRIIMAELIKYESASELQDGSFMNQPEV